MCPHLYRQLDGSLWMEDGLTKRDCSAESVTLALVEKQVTFGEDYVTVPLMEIAEGGLLFPMPKMLKDFLSYFGLTPCQLSVNGFRIINCCAEISRTRKIEFRLCDLMHIFNLSRNQKF